MTVFVNISTLHDRETNFMSNNLTLTFRYLYMEIK